MKLAILGVTAALLFPVMAAAARPFDPSTPLRVVLSSSKDDFAQGGQEGSAVGSQMAGRHVYEEQCSRCHGPEGREGKAPWLVPFRWNYQQALNIIRNGGACGMPAFPESELSDEQVKQIVDYLKSLE